MSGSREEERRKLADIINHWNANRLDLFEISQPTENDKTCPTGLVVVSGALVSWASSSASVAPLIKAIRAQRMFTLTRKITVTTNSCCVRMETRALMSACEHELLDLEFHGVMRFYFQDRVAGNFATKCIRVSSTATTQDVIETLAEKFRPDMRMLSSPKYSLYEVHVSGEERKLDLDEKPLVVQLNWNKDDREGRFVLKNENDIIPKRTLINGPEKEKEGVIQNFKRTLSKKEKKKEKKREKEAFSRIPDGDDHALNREDGLN
ncbi:afadin-like isoform X9 [Labeo rohita]|uniref:Afadin-like isoform X9 n=1 Tax=Labeo rohita TaxID=84645 RepID=A0A498MP56_LABRO|nr:afadin-like isoform X9 [Labeo rohita]RXN23289.1 afadin-like isoform X9 [Labeo rohita]